MHFVAKCKELKVNLSQTPTTGLLLMRLNKVRSRSQSFSCIVAQSIVCILLRSLFYVCVNLFFSENNV